MVKTKMFLRFVAVAAALLLSVWLLSETKLNAKSRSKGATLTGTWYLSVPSGLRTFLTFHKGGTLSEVTSFGFGGPPMTPLGPVARSTDLGIWNRAGKKFESLIFRFVYALGSGDALQITRIRSVYSLDPGFENGSGEFFVMAWSCPTPLECPDPNVDPPDGPEFGPPGNSFTMTRVRML